jgi:hypothetical protein
MVMQERGEVVGSYYNLIGQMTKAKNPQLVIVLHCPFVDSDLGSGPRIKCDGEHTNAFQLIYRMGGENKWPVTHAILTTRKSSCRIDSRIAFFERNLRVACQCEREPVSFQQAFSHAAMP